MTARPGRGRPAVFAADVQAQFLDLVAAGVHLGEAARKVGIHHNVPSYHARTNETFAADLADAKDRGRQARIEKRGHDEYRYNVLGCRCPKCRAAATKARTGRRAEADTQQAPDEAGEHPAPGPESPTSFLLPRLSSWTGQQAA
ncbi:hypothetical protein GPZ77_34795 (plasmid) [Streptomyces sp. QHH-9511]|uniref:hypothetical protein n=1 Tax=Streptomyces sp. QHH-9511 TaxID=2684468 RepID=UPI001316CC6D|nr:hypothetical protein [Streptomyces sp. QHH-9511]QGZ53397.1 hypothetical protein GPZ77_34795 [Streptomyces sp. QHH-9511]